MDIKGKVILITGASSGIGASTAKAFDRKGAKIAMAARRLERLNILAADMHESLTLPVDMSDELQARKMVMDVIAHFGRLDVLINNAACIIVSPAATVSAEDLLMAFHTNLTGPVAATQEAWTQMRKQKSGHIINIGSPGFMMGIPFYSPYVCSKAAFSAWTRTIQSEWSGHGVFISEFFPGYVLTDSKPDSRIGDVDQDFLMSPNQNWLSRKFTKPASPDQIALQLIRLVNKPKTLVYSGFSVRLGAVISHFSGFRLSIARQMVETARMKMKSQGLI